MINKYKEKLHKHPFVKNFITALTGTGLAQIIGISTTLLLAKYYYTPAHYGIFSLFASFIAPLNILVMMQYAHAVLLPKKHLKAGQIALLAASISLAFGIFVFVLMFIFRQQCYILVDGTDTPKYWLFLVPVSIVTAGFSEALSVWTARMRRYKRNAIARITVTVVIFVVQIPFMLYKPSEYGLIISFVVGQMAGVFWQIFCAFKYEGSFLVWDFSQIKILAKNYKTVWFAVPASLFIVLADQLPIYNLNAMATKFELGNFGMCTRILAAPVTLVAMSMSEVFGQKASAIYKSGEKPTAFFIKTLKTMLLLSLVPFALLLLFAPNIFGILGEKWRLAGVMTQYFGIMYWAKFLVAPVSYMYFIAQRQKELMLMGFLLFVGCYAAIYVVQWYAPNNILYILGAFALVYSLYYAVLLWRSYQFTLHPPPLA